MSLSFACPHGHSWEPDGREQHSGTMRRIVCPVCGAAASRACNPGPADLQSPRISANESGLRLARRPGSVTLLRLIRRLWAAEITP
jgi:hypothetical protein